VAYIARKLEQLDKLRIAFVRRIERKDRSMELPRILTSDIRHDAQTPGKGCRKRKYFHMHIRKYNRAFGGDVCHKRAVSRWTDTTDVSKQIRGFFFLRARGYTACAYMQRQYFECIMNGARVPARYRQKVPRFALSIPRRSILHILHGRNSHLQQQFSPMYAHPPRRDKLQGCKCARTYAVLFFGFETEV